MLAIPLFAAPCWIDSITTDKIGNVYYTTRDGGVWKYNRNHRSVKLATVPRRTSFNGGIVLTEEKDALYMCHTYENTVLRYNLKLQTLDVFKNELKFPRAICFNQEGALFVAERKTIQQIPGNKEPNRDDLLNPISMVMKSSDVVYVCERGQNRIKVVTWPRLPPNEEFLPFYFDNPKGLCMDNDGNLLVIDRVGVRKVNLARKQLFTLPIGPANCIAVDHEGTMIVTIQEKMCVVNSWIIERILWIGFHKNDPRYCPFAILPQEMVTEIAKLIKVQFAWITQ